MPREKGTLTSPTPIFDASHEVKVIGAAPARTKSSHEEALATEQRQRGRGEDSAAALASAPWNKKKQLGAKRSKSSAPRQRRPSLATMRRLLQSSAETNARDRNHHRCRLQQNCCGMLD